MAGSGSRFPWMGSRGLWDPSWAPGSRNQNADSDTDSEHRNFQEDRQQWATGTSDDEDTISHVSGGDNEAKPSDADAETSSHNNAGDNEAEPSDADTASHIIVKDLGDIRKMNLSADPVVDSSDPILNTNISTGPDVDSSDLTSVDSTASPTIDPEGTVSESEIAPLRVARNGYNHNVDDFTDLYKTLHLRSEYYQKFHGHITELHTDDEVKEALASGTKKGVADIASEFLLRYGNSIWKLKGKNSQQDRKHYRETLFDIKKEPERLNPILVELWFRVRDLLYTDARPEAESAPLLPLGPWTIYGNRDNPNLRAGPLPAEIPSRVREPEEWEDGPEQRADELRFLAKVRSGPLRD